MRSSHAVRSARRCSRRLPAARADRASTRCRDRSCRSPPIARQANIKHEEIKGFMAAMTMPYKVRDAKEFADLDARRPHHRDARRRQQRRLPEGREEGRRSAAREAAASSAAVGLVGIRAAEAGRAGAGRRFVDQDGKTARPRVVQGPDGRRDVHLHAVSDADVLPADGPALRGHPGASSRPIRRLRTSICSASASIRSPTRRRC